MKFSKTYVYNGKAETDKGKGDVQLCKANSETDKKYIGWRQNNTASYALYIWERKLFINLIKRKT